MIRPSVISCAMPRPIVIRISVATKGWMPMTETRTPFHSPASAPAPSASSSATGRPQPAVIAVAATAPQIAMMVPTERSMPRVAMTSVIPVASSATGAARLATSISGPTRRPSWNEIVRNAG